jgi:sugar phosphate isomerase/epimerase
MNSSIASYSFHRLLRDGKQDMFGYMRDCGALGVTHLEPWNGHFVVQGLEFGDAPRLGDSVQLEYLQKVKAVAASAKLPFGCIAVDGAHIYEEDEAKRQLHRKRAAQWLEVAQFLGAKQLRIDSGYRGEVWPDDVFNLIVTGYNNLITEAESKGIEIVIENHWGPSQHPEQLVRLLSAVPKLGLLFDTNNWAEGKQQQGWQLCAKYAKAVHVKTFSFDAKGDDPSVDLKKAITLLHGQGYDGIWGVESVPDDGDEIAAAKRTLELIQRVLGE